MTYQAQYNSTNAKEELRSLIKYYDDQSEKEFLEFDPISKLAEFLDHPNFLNYQRDSIYSDLHSDFEEALSRFNQQVKESLLELSRKMKNSKDYGNDYNDFQNAYIKLSRFLWDVHNFAEPVRHDFYSLKALYTKYVEHTKELLRFIHDLIS